MFYPLRSVKVITYLALLLVVSACASMDKKPQSSSDGSPDSQLIYTSAQQTMSAAKPDDMTVTSYGLPSDTIAPENADQTYASLAQSQSNGSVQIFPLDGPAPSPDSDMAQSDIAQSTTNLSSMPQTAMGMPTSNVDDMSVASAPLPLQSAEPKGVPYSKDSDVEVFPFEDQSTAQTLPVSAGLGQQTGLPSLETSWPTAQGEASRIYFANGSAALNVSGRQILQQVAANAGSGKLISIEAHASKRAKAKDPIERRIINLRMSMQRAEKVSAALIRKGVPADSIKTTAYGDTRDPQIVPNGMSKEAASRRVDIVTPSQQP